MDLVDTGLRGLGLGLLWSSTASIMGNILFITFCVDPYQVKFSLDIKILGYGRAFRAEQ
jgi:hypothetical protein